MPISLPSFSLIYSLLILLPGFLTYKIARRIGKVTVQIDRFDKIIYTVIGSGTSFSIILIVYSHFTSFNPTHIQNMEFSIEEMGLGYLLMLLVSLLIGVFIGLLIDKWLNSGVDIRNESTWQIISDGRQEPAKVRAIMNNGNEVWGEIQVSDSEPHGQDLFLKYPEKVVRANDGTIKNTVPIGEYAFLSQGDISHIYFESEVSVRPV
ncbi:DUF6338 family protein [Natrinema gelatinilyticum]|uniref:DUF6338 family protein n=1 Tax=Natrinema gelatinilyticum TaxID=2961571 RepID=UPI00211574AA|nr:DUF6338 family protein [Natrinema gelatinilyticum]